MNLNPVETVVMVEGDKLNVGFPCVYATRATIESAIRYWDEMPDPDIARLMTRELGGKLYLCAELTPLGVERCVMGVSPFRIRFDVPMPAID